MSVALLYICRVNGRNNTEKDKHVLHLFYCHSVEVPLYYREFVYVHVMMSFAPSFLSLGRREAVSQWRSCYNGSPQGRETCRSTTTESPGCLDIRTQCINTHTHCMEAHMQFTTTCKDGLCTHAHQSRVKRRATAESLRG